MGMDRAVIMNQDSGSLMGKMPVAPFRLASPKAMTMDQLYERLDPLLKASTEELLMIREKTYSVLDRMDELEQRGQYVGVAEFEEILRGAAVVEELIAERMQGVYRKKPELLKRKAEAY